MDWTSLMQTAQLADADGIKAALPIAYVLERAGRTILSYNGEAAQTSCPFHEDSQPSFDLYGERLERWGCYPCGKNGDVLDLIQGIFSVDFPVACEMATQLIGEMKDAGWTGPTTGVRREFDWDKARDLVAQTRTVDPTSVVDDFLRTKVEQGNSGIDVTAGWLIQEFRIGASGAEIVIPYYGADGELISYKHRTASTKALSPTGKGQFDGALYGEWRDLDPEKPVVLCEGESDVWAATAALSGFVALGLPTGAGSFPKQASKLAGRNVVLAFDGDEAGRKGVRVWHEALAAEGATVMIAPVPDGHDLAGMTPDQIADVVRRSRAVPAVPTGLLLSTEGYVRPGKEVSTPISNWSFSPTRELRGDGGSAYEGSVMPSGIPAVLSSFDLGSKNRIVQWSTSQGGAWYGADREAQLLLGTLQAQGPFLSSGRMATVAGLHEGQFIWPGGRIGSDYWVYVPPTTDVHLADRMSIKPGDWSVGQVTVLRELHDHRVMDPILAWLAAAPIRSLLREFPILAVTGSSGTGKTTLLETVVKNFTGSLITNNLTATTRHSIFSFVGSTNGFPVWFDEYRPGARKDAIESLNQLIRDAYTGQASSKGGMGDHWAEITSVKTSAPLIVSGEDAFSETSHTERMVLCALPVGGRNAETLERVKSWGEHGFAHAYLEWLYIGLQDGYLPELRNFDAGPVDLPPRQRLNLGVLSLGWALLTQFVRTFDFGIELGEPDFSLIIEEGRESAQHNPIQDAILWAVDEFEAVEFAANTNGQIGLRVENFVHFVTIKGGFTLPGGTKAVISYIRNHYGAEEGTYKFMGSSKRAWVFPSDVFETTV